MPEPAGYIAGGRILWDGEDLLERTWSAMRPLRGREIAMIFQEPMSSLSPVHTIGDQIIEVLRLHLGLSKAAARARAIELLAAGLDDPEASVRGSAGAALARVTQGRIAYDPDWQQSARQDAAAKLRALHNRAP